MIHKRCVPFVGRLSSCTARVKQITGLESCQCRKGRIKAQSHRLCHVSLLSFQRTSLRNRGNSLSNQVRSIERLLDSATQIPLCQNGFCVSPTLNYFANILSVTLKFSNQDLRICSKEVFADDFTSQPQLVPHEDFPENDFTLRQTFDPT